MASLGFLSFKEHLFIYTKYSKVGGGGGNLAPSPFSEKSDTSRTTLALASFGVHGTSMKSSPRGSHSIHECLADGEGVKRSVILDSYFL